MALAELVDTWLELAVLMTGHDLAGDTEVRRDWQPSLGAGAAGIAHVLGTIGQDRSDPMLTASSRRWFAIARRMPPPRRHRHSLVFGTLGNVVSRAACAPTRTSSGDVARAIRLAGRAPAEYMLGIAGHAMAALATGADAARLRAIDATLRRRALPDSLGFAHGALGVIVARLALARALGDSPEAALVAWLRAYDPPRVLAESGTWKRSWCNGLAGFVFGWALAAQSADDERCRDHAIAAAPHLLEVLDEAGGSLCCGLGGRAYALLAIARLDKREEHVAHAARLARFALSARLPVGGLWKGVPGLVGLAHAIAHDPARARFPFVDVA